MVFPSLTLRTFEGETTSPTSDIAPPLVLLETEEADKTLLSTEDPPGSVVKMKNQGQIMHRCTAHLAASLFEEIWRLDWYTV